MSDDTTNQLNTYIAFTRPWNYADSVREFFIASGDNLAELCRKVHEADRRLAYIYQLLPSLLATVAIYDNGLASEVWIFPDPVHVPFETKYHIGDRVVQTDGTGGFEISFITVRLSAWDFVSPPKWVIYGYGDDYRNGTPEDWLKPIDDDPGRYDYWNRPGEWY